MKVISLLSTLSIFGSGKMSFTLFLRQTRGEGWLLITFQLCWYFKKRRIKSSCYVTICSLFWNLVTIVIAFVPVHVYTLKFWENKERFIIFLKNAYSAFFSTLKRSYLWKMHGYTQFSFLISIAPDMIYLSHIVIIWEKILPISGHRP